ncbi:MAG: M48 family metallopeptidase [Rectinemataceae bacterium]|nr:M48 family metallopeptidase [Rectinemataceae bacterium]
MSGSPYAVQELKRRALQWSVTLHVNPHAVRIQKMKNKWGSCSTGGTITLAEDLIDQDASFQNYVIVHELLHMRIPAHGRLFKALMSIHVPNWKKMDELRLDGRNVSLPFSDCTQDNRITLRHQRF